MNREDFNRQVIVYNDIAQRLTFGLSEAGMFTNNTVYFIKAREADIQYLLAVLNSRIIDWYYRTLSVQLGEKAVRMFSIFVERLPIPLLKSEEKILITNKMHTDIIDHAICNLYDLSADEINIIERG